MINNFEFILALQFIWTYLRLHHELWNILQLHLDLHMDLVALAHCKRDL